MYVDLGKLSVVMPAYNEGSTISDNAEEASVAIARLVPDYEIIVVNDGSGDDTLVKAWAVAEKDSHIKVIDSQPNAGKGHALCVGVAEATGEYIAFCDSDLDLHPDQLGEFIRIMQEKSCDVVIGSKMHPQSKVEYPLYRHIVSWGYYIFLLILFRLNVKDTQTGLKLFRADVIKPVMKQILVKKFAFDIEVLAIINSRGYEIESAPITVSFRRGAWGSRIRLKDIYNMVVDTLAIFYRLKILHYYDRNLPNMHDNNKELNHSEKGFNHNSG